jgi:N utilization substance protein A
MKSDFALAFNEILEARALPKEVVLEAIQQALVSAYRRDASVSSNQQRIEATISESGVPQILVEKEVVNDVVDPRTEVLLDEAQEQYPECELSDMVMMVAVVGANFGRIAAQTAKQVILQRIREAERETLYEEFIEREGDLITGTVQSVSPAGVTMNLLGRAEAVMPRAHQMSNERYRPHDKVRVYVVEVNKSTRGPQIIVSRTHKDMLRRLLEYEVPEIYNGQIEIKNIAREAGYRSKVAVAALQDSIDPVGACVGMRGMRIQNIIKELNDEKIDVIEWDAEPAKFIAKALSPARISGVYLNEAVDQMRTATVVVPEDHLSLAIGREGQNARLAAKLTGWRIDIKSVTETAIEDFSQLDVMPLAEIAETYPDTIEEIDRILEKKRNNRPIMPEEYTTLVQFVNLAEESKSVYREMAQSERLAILDTVRPLVPEAAFEMPIERLELADDIVKALGRIDNVGELMIRVLSDEEYLAEVLRVNHAGDDAMEAIKYALDDLVLPELMSTDEAVEEAAVDFEDVDEVEDQPIDLVEEEEELVEEEPVAEEPDVVEDLPPVDPEEEAPPAFPVPEVVAEEEELIETEVVLGDVEEEDAASPAPESGDWEWDENYDDSTSFEEEKPKKSKKRRQKRVQLVYDEDLGEVIAKRRRKGSRRRQAYDDFDIEDME